jgi:hypothetical protein
MTRRFSPNALSFEQKLLFSGAALDSKPLARVPDNWRFHPLVKQAAVLGFVLGFAGSVLVQSLRHPKADRLAQSPRPATSLSAVLPR